MALRRTRSAAAVCEVAYSPDWKKNRGPSAAPQERFLEPLQARPRYTRSRTERALIAGAARVAPAGPGVRGPHSQFFHELRCFYSQSYRVQMVRSALRAEMERAGFTMYWALIDTDENGTLDRQELAAAVAAAGVDVSDMEVGALFDDVAEPGNDETDERAVTEDGFYEWVLSTRDRWMVQARRLNDGGDPHCDVGLLLRESARHDAGVRACLDALWKLVDSDGSGLIDRDEYLALHANLYVAMNEPDASDAGAAFEARRAAENEWEFDARGAAGLTAAGFRLSFFQLVDAWLSQEHVGPPRGFDVDELSAETYARFLRYLMHRVCVVEAPPPGGGLPVRFRWDASPDGWVRDLPPLQLQGAAAVAALNAGARMVALLLGTNAVIESGDWGASRLRLRRNAVVVAAESAQRLRLRVSRGSRAGSDV
eukprot:CAMPEP_0184197788 /NCGR_PEP_ID=MMETSP0976-20121227/6191_1 /TAXON_ID=483370 /ORGANISM="non described non described, Strain CCMP2097" /LENGTH=425 /DNA_ID=CAMNT_0026502265 /DNA_START=1 /DNA_END=1274 /DNA_ORIENTATION=+